MLLVICLLFAIGYYLTAEPRPLHLYPEHSAYNQLADAFLAGQTSLLVKPAPELVSLPDPYDPAANGRYRLHDMSLYKGRWFLYFGPSPVITLFIPWRLLTGSVLPDHLGVVIFACGALFAGIQLLRRLLTQFFPDTSATWFYFFSIVLGFANVMPFLLRRPQFYETAIACGQCFALFGIWGVFGLIARPAAYKAAPFAGLAFGLAVGARPQLVFAGLAVLLLLVFPVLVPARQRWRNALLVAVPFGLALVALASYNYVRFDSPFEFGNHYQLAAVNVRQLGSFRPGAFLTSLYFTLVSPVSLSGRFPFLFGTSDPPFDLPNHYGLEAIAGIVWLLPYVLALFSAPRLVRKVSQERSNLLRSTLILFTTMIAIWIAIDGSVGATMRYCADWSSAAYIASVLVLAGWLNLSRNSFLPIALLVMGFWTLLVNAALAYNSYFGIP